MAPQYSEFARSVRTETAFDVLASARRWKGAGKDVIELEIGDSPFPSSSSAVAAGIQAIRDDHCHYGPSAGIPDLREAAAEYLNREYQLGLTAANVVIGPGAKNFEQLFCEAFLDPGDRVLVFSPHFPTYPPNIARRGARMEISKLEQASDFRPDVEDVERFVESGSGARAIFLNSPHNPTGGVAREEDLRQIADLIRGRDVAVFSDEPYDRMVWEGRHHTILEQPEMLDHCVAAYTFSKSYSMSGWRLGFAAGSPKTIEMLAKLTNTCLSCVPPFTQLAGAAALRHDAAERDARMEQFRQKVQRLAQRLNEIEEVNCNIPGGTFYVFPSVSQVCNRLHITSHGLAMFLLDAADEQLGVACLGGECFGEAGAGFLRLSCAEPEERLEQAVEFMRRAFQDEQRVRHYLETQPHFRLTQPYRDTPPRH
jgi:aspartate aminotransferase